jgi:drug/metabolite transporter (DMT)-like permease
MLKKNEQVLLIILCLTWGSTWLAIKIGVNEAPPIFFAGTRFVAAGTILIAWHKWQNGQTRIDKSDWLSLVMLGFSVIAVTFGLIIWGEQWVSSGLTAVLVQGIIPISMYIFLFG